MLRILSAALAPLVFSACTAMPLPDVLPQQAAYDPAASIHNPAYAAVTGGYTHRMPAPPKPWRQMNDGQAPATGEGS
jgi:hypothetical protein